MRSPFATDRLLTLLGIFVAKSLGPMLEAHNSVAPFWMLTRTPSFFGLAMPPGLSNCCNCTGAVMLMVPLYGASHRRTTSCKGNFFSFFLCRAVFFLKKVL